MLDAVVADETVEVPAGAEDRQYELQDAHRLAPRDPLIAAAHRRAD